MPTLLQGFDQIIAVTQDHINASLDTLFLLDEKLAEFKFSDPDGGWEISADMKPATVVFDPKDEPHKVWFCLHLSSGTFTWYTYGKFDPNTHTVPATPHTAPIKDWTLAFTVNLSLTKLDDGSVPDDIKKKISLPGSYSLHQLLLDFTTADLSSFNPTMSTKFEPPLGDSSEAKRDKSLENAVDTYLKSLHGSGSNILGYAITVPDPKTTNPVNPSFPPTSVTFQTMKAENAKEGLSCFLFLEMTEDRAFPPITTVTWTQNWVEDGKSGSMVISKENFWDRFFVKRSTFLNDIGLDLLNALGNIVDHPNSTSINVKWNITDKKPSGAQLDWPHSSTDPPRVWYKWSHHDGSRHFEAEVRADLHLGENTMEVTGSAHTIFDSEDHQDVGNIDWGYSLTLDTVADGTLAISVARTYLSCYIVSYGRKTVINEELTNKLKAHLDSNGDTILNEINKGLTTQSQFVFPGGGTFFMKNPKFNDYGDLTIELQYKQE